MSHSTDKLGKDLTTEGNHSGEQVKKFVDPPYAKHKNVF
jgi:hypothetical protein